MNQFHKLFRWAWSILVVCTLAFAMGGCEGDDGAQGPAGPAGPVGADGADGPPGPGAEITPLESCGVCHGDGNFMDASAGHALDPIEAVSNIVFGTANAGADLTVTFDLAADGAPALTYNEIQRAYYNNGGTRTDLRDPTTGLDGIATLTHNGGGNYTITLIGQGALAATDLRWLFRVQDSAERETRVYFYADNPTNPFAADVSPVQVGAAACEACHGPEGIPVHGSAFIASDGGEVCLVCHGSDEGDPLDVTPSLGAVTHEYHAGLRDPITYPTYMTNCSVCHAEASELATVNAMSVSGAGCLTCHGSMDNEIWDFSGGLSFHLTQPADVDCASSTCHSLTGGANLLVDVTDFHNGASTERSGLIWEGADVAVTEADRFTWQITGVVDDGTNLAISWTATYDTVAVDPCNATVGAGAPVFFLPGGGSGGTHSMLLNYAQGGDYILGQDGRPGYGSSVNLTVDNTTCTGLVATTTIPAEVVDATYGRVALQGKPGVVSPADATALLRVRVPTPTFDWELGTSNPAPARRGVVDTDACLGCHVGSLYQHGGNRVDNVDVCMQCHNAAANEKYVRVDMGVDASEAYDGKVGETYEMKTMLHRIHSANYDWNPERGIEEYNAPYLVYRGRGIYAFAGEGEIPPNWDPTVVDGCDAEEIADGKSRVFGSDPDAADACEVHNYHNPTFPRSLNDCASCHVAGFGVIPDQGVVMATTVDPGEAPWNDYTDDVLQGAGATACTSCHYNSAARGHAYQNGWTPQDFPMGRQSIIDAAN